MAQLTLWQRMIGSFSNGSVVMNLPVNVGDAKHRVDIWVGKILGRNDHPTQYCLENPQTGQPGGLQTKGHN